MRRHGHTTPTPDRSQAAFLACRAARLAREAGASEAQCQAVHDRTYATLVRAPGGGVLGAQ